VKSAEARLATTNDAQGIGLALARAFENDPLYAWLLPVASTRVARLTKLFTTLARHVFVPEGVSYTFDAHDGAALWVPPGAPAVRVGAALFSARGVVSSLGTRMIPGGRVLAKLEAVHPKEPHHYLAMLGVSPAQQGKGLSRSLVAPMLARADAEKRLAYLETAKESNIALYRRFGFEVTGELQALDAPKLWCMTRTPRAGSVGASA
jgi:ribosomal protein S18 acetylase RimI-like enzyme